MKFSDSNKQIRLIPKQYPIQNVVSFEHQPEFAMDATLDSLSPKTQINIALSSHHCVVLLKVMMPFV